MFLFEHAANIYNIFDTKKFYVDNLGDIYYNTSSTTTQTTELSSLLALIREKEEIIREQDREIGRLEERIRQMTIEKEKHVSDAPISGTANVG